MSLREQLEKELDQTFGRLTTSINTLQDSIDKQEEDLRKTRQTRRQERDFNFRKLHRY
nr:MAG TPA: Microtubule integrity protein mal3 domain, microtubule-binding, coiled-coil, cell.33A [Caudoviricetes sp.]